MHWFQAFRPLLFPCLPHAKVQLPAQTLQLHLFAMSLERHRALQLALLQDRMNVEEAVGAGGRRQAGAPRRGPRRPSRPLGVGRRSQYRLLASDEHKKGVAAFIAKRPAQF